jgi:hypothetical protein
MLHDQALVLNGLPKGEVQRLELPERVRWIKTLGKSAYWAWNELRSTVSIPSAKIDYSQVTAMRFAARDKVQGAVQGTTNQTTIVRDGRARDYTNAAAAAAGFSRNSNVGALVANTWLVADRSFALPNNKALCVLGYVSYTSPPVIDAIRFTLGGIVALAEYALCVLAVDLTYRGCYFDPPLVYAPGQVFAYDLLAAAAILAGAETFGQFGYASEPAGLSVLPDQANLV